MPTMDVRVRSIWLCQKRPLDSALAIASDLYRAMDMTFWLPQAEATLAQVG